jgi:hypothetical protein
LSRWKEGGRGGERESKRREEGWRESEMWSDGQTYRTLLPDVLNPSADNGCLLEASQAIHLKGNTGLAGISNVKGRPRRRDEGVHDRMIVEWHAQT